MYQGTLPARSNRAGWSPIIEISDDDSGDAVDLADATIVFELRDPDDRTTMLSATSSSGISILDTGVFQVSFTAEQMRQLCAKTYEIGCTIGNADSEPQQLILGTVPILDGIVQ